MHQLKRLPAFAGSLFFLHRKLRSTSHDCNTSYE
jgi:hypothetical protein